MLQTAPPVIQKLWYLMFIINQGLVKFYINLVRNGDAYMHSWLGSSLFHVMACSLFDNKLLFECMMIYCQLDTQEKQISIKFYCKFTKFC